MSIIGHIRTIPDRGKSDAVKKLIKESTPDFDFFFLTVLAVLMATFGLLENNTAVVIGSMLVAPILFPILSLSLSIVMSDYKLIVRASGTLMKTVILGVSMSFFATLFLGGGDVLTPEIIARIEPSLLSIAIAIVSGFAVAYALVLPEMNEAFPGVAVAVALIPPLAVIGIGLAAFNWTVIAGAAIYLLVNVIGIIFASMLMFSLMDLYQKRTIASKTAVSADREAELETKKIQEKEDEELNA
ncbi:MAG: TIGR00341 family protein [Patescibacteria group bacterium UBA2163]